MLIYKGCVLRFPDMYGAPGDLSLPSGWRCATSTSAAKPYSAPTRPCTPFTLEDVVAAVIHALDKTPQGIFNVCDNDNLPGTNRQVFDAPAVKTIRRRWSFRPDHAPQEDIRRQVVRHRLQGQAPRPQRPLLAGQRP